MLEKNKKQTKNLKEILERAEPHAKVWLEHKGEPVVGKGRRNLLNAIEKHRSLAKASKNTKVSFRAAWNWLRKIEERLGVKIVDSKKGGEGGGGTTVLTEVGKRILRKYDNFDAYIQDALKNPELWEACGLKLSARNKLKGIVKSVEKDGVTAKVKIEIKVPTTVTSVITKEAVEDLEIKEGDEVEAVIKSTEVMVLKR